MVKMSIEPFYIIPSAALRENNHLPDIQSNKDLHANIAIDEQTISPDEARYMGWGRVNGILPYKLQDSYDRIKKPRPWKAVILQNDYLRAVFLPQVGGRLWRLTDLETGRELVHHNPVFQPCNLALRNAWVSGGVEWNIGVIGHTPYTVDSMHAEYFQLKDGTPVLRMYQYERIRSLVYRIDAMLPEDSRQLIVHVRIENPLDEETAVYWWSNIAVDEREGVRVFAPAKRAYRYGYGGKLAKVPTPYYEGIDISHTTQIPRAIDFFFDLEDGQRRWISALDENGYGLAQVSTDVLSGRKLFAWGMGDGGRHWQSFLSEPGQAYFEIQAGLARTQLEHLPMKGRQVIEWTEAYGAVRTDAQTVAGADYGEATAAVEAALEQACPRAAFDALDERLSKELEVNRVSAVPIHRGDGWGFLEMRICGKSFDAKGVYFSSSTLGKAEEEWYQLLTTGALPCRNPLLTPGGYQVNDRWMRALSDSIQSGKSDHWYGNYHMGVMRAYRNDVKGARESFGRSLECARSPWALRCLSVLDEQSGNLESAADLIVEAAQLRTRRHFVVEAMRVLFKTKQFARLDTFWHSLSAPMQQTGRVQVIHIEALLEEGKLQQAEQALFTKIELNDVREGEVSLTELWFKLCALKIAKAEKIAVDDELMKRVRAAYPPPAALDFRMR